MAAVGAVVVGLVALPHVGPRADAAESDAADTGRLESIAELAPDPTLDPRILELDLGPGYRSAADRLETAIFELNEGRRTEVRLGLARSALQAEAVEVDEALAQARTDVARLRDETDEVTEQVRLHAVEMFVNHGQDDLAAFDGPAADVDVIRDQTLSTDAADTQIERLASLETQLAQRRTERDALASRASELAVRIPSTTAALEAAAVRSQQLVADVESARGGVVSARRMADVPGLDFSVTALDAYLDAERRIAADRPECGLQWWMIAGVAKIESRHGEIGGRSIRPDGRPDEPILGIPLDGRPGVREIRDTDDGLYDADTTYDRAVGPLQFIPDTWRWRGRDGNLDGRLDPQNMYDAAYSTGHYLCWLGGNLASTSSLRGAYFEYNTSSVYVADVHGHAVRYARFDLPS